MQQSAPSATAFTDIGNQRTRLTLKTGLLSDSKRPPS